MQLILSTPSLFRKYKLKPYLFQQFKYPSAFKRQRKIKYWMQMFSDKHDTCCNNKNAFLTVVKFFWKHILLWDLTKQRAILEGWSEHRAALCLQQETSPQPNQIKLQASLLHPYHISVSMWLCLSVCVYQWMCVCVVCVVRRPRQLSCSWSWLSANVWLDGCALFQKRRLCPHDHALFVLDNVPVRFSFFNHYSVYILDYWMMRHRGDER